MPPLDNPIIAHRRRADGGATPTLGPYDTQLSPQEEAAFGVWKQKYAPHDSGDDYDLRGAFKAGLTPDPKTGHWPDTYKKPNEPTFSDESIYARFGNPGHWTGPNHDQYIPGNIPAYADGGGPSEPDVLSDEQVLAHATRAAGPTALSDDEVFAQAGLSRDTAFGTGVTGGLQSAVTGTGKAMSGMAEMASHFAHFEPYYQTYQDLPNMSPADQRAARLSVIHDPNLTDMEKGWINSRFGSRLGGENMPKEEFAGVPAPQTGLAKAGESVTKAGEEEFPVNPRSAAAHPTALGIGSNIGSMVPVLAGSAAATLAGVPEAAIPIGAAVMTGQGAEGQAEAARAKGAPEGAVTGAAQAGGLTGAAMSVPVLEGILAPVVRNAPGLLSWAVAKAQGMIRSGAVFGTIGEVQQAVSQEIAKTFYDPKTGTYRPDLMRIAEDAASGAVLGLAGHTPLAERPGEQPAQASPGGAGATPTAPAPAGGSPGVPPNTAGAPPRPITPPSNLPPDADAANHGEYRAGQDPRTGLFHVTDSQGTLLSEPHQNVEDANAAAQRMNLLAIANTTPPAVGSSASGTAATPPTPAGMPRYDAGAGQAAPAPPTPPAPPAGPANGGELSRTSPEPTADLHAQIAALGDPGNTKDAVFVSANDVNKIPPRRDLPPEVMRLDRPEGTLLTTDGAKARIFHQAPQLTDDIMAPLLGYPDTKANAGASGAPAVVQARDRDGNVVSEALTSPQKAAETRDALARQVPPGGDLAAGTPEEALARRVAADQAEQDGWTPMSDDAALAHAQAVAQQDRAAGAAHSNPSDAQKAANNYNHGHVDFQGLDVSVETPKGAQRTGIGANGESWSNTSPAHYGYIRGTEGSDQEHIDTYLGPNPQSDRVFVFDQYNPDGSFDEHKVVLGANNRAMARRIYDGGFSDGSGPARRGSLTEYSMDEFKDWLRTGDTTAPLGPPRRDSNAPAPVRRPPDIIDYLIANGGLQDQGGEVRVRDMNLAQKGRFGVLMNKNGMTHDHAAEMLQQPSIGYLRPGEGINEMWDAIDETLAGNPRFSASDLSQAQDWRDQKRTYNIDYRTQAERRAQELGIEVTDDMSTDELVAAIDERVAMMTEPPLADAARDRLEDDIDRIAAAEDIPWPESTDERQAQTRPEPGPPQATREVATGQAPQPPPVIGGPEPGAHPAGRSAPGDQGPGVRDLSAYGAVDKTAAGEQVVLPGAEQSAVQAAQAQEAAGHGKVPTPPGQKPADEGLFAPSPDTTGDLLAPRPDRSPWAKPGSERETPTGRPTFTDTLNSLGRVLPNVNLAMNVAEHLGAGEPLTAKRLQEMAETAFGSKLSEGKFDRSDMYDALELGVNKYIRDHAAEFDPRVKERGALAAVEALEELKKSLPTQTVRAGEKESHQQFSTPPDYSYAAAWLANIGEHDRVLEPSAGTGSLAVHAMNAHPAEVVTNELSDKRADMLASLHKGRQFRENAEQLNNILPEDVRPSVVVMNPPFSASAERLGDRRDTMIGAQHVEQALARLEPGGRLVAIVGGGMKPDAARFKDWWGRIGAKYDVRANVGVGGGVYQKYGTTFPTRILVIDKVEPSGRVPVIGEVKDIPELIQRLDGVRDDRPIEQPTPAGERLAGQPPGEAVAPPRQPGTRPDEAVPPATPKLGVRGERPAPRPGGEIPGRPGDRGGETVQRPVQPGEDNTLATQQPERPGNAGADRNPPGSAGERGDVAEGRAGADGDVLRPDERGQSELSAGGERDVEAPATESVRVDEAVSDPTHDSGISEAVYEPYKPQRVTIAGAQPHPGELVQSAAMASVMPPMTDYAPHLPKDLISSGALSGAQLEAVVYAGRAHAQMLPHGEDEIPVRRGFFVGDSTGVGKGREASGIILDNWSQGRQKAVWISEKKTLLNDARRDWSGLGQDPKHVFDIGKVKPGGDITANKGILFSTYDTLKGGERLGKDPETGKTKMGKTRVDQIVNWFGKDFDGVIIFDESHNMANATATKGDRGIKDAAQKALSGIELQKRLPNARIVYSSATGATEVSNLAYAERLGLWGRGTAFATRSDFVNKIEQGGIAAMELVARDMKAMGHYIARSLSYRGVEYDKLEHKLDPDQQAIYDRLAEAWQVTLNNIQEALKVTGGDKNGNTKSKAASIYWGTHQRFFNQIVTSLQMPTVVRAVERDLAEHKQVVLQLTNTNEASQERAIAKAESAEDLEDLDMTPRDQILQMVENSFPVAAHEEYVDEKGVLRSRVVLDSNGAPVEDKQAVAMRDKLLQDLQDIRVPEGPLEILLNHFGTDKVAEVTGRSQRVVRRTDEKGNVKTVQESRPGSANVAEAQAFQDAKKPILVFSAAGGTGRSYHAENGTPSADYRRSHYLIQAGWRADTAIQGFGRTHRTNEASQPQFHLVTTDLKGQKRFISSIARRLAQLGALTKGERRTGDQGLFSARDNLESREAREGLRQFFDDLYRGEVPDVSIGEFEQQTGLSLVDKQTGGLTNDLPPITKFLNRLLSLKVDMQNKVFDAFDQRFSDAIDRHAAAGTLDTGVETVKGDRITKEQEHSVYRDKETGAETKYVRLNVETKNKPSTFDQISSGEGKTSGRIPIFYTRSAKTGKVYAVSEASAVTDGRTGRIVDQYRLTDPLDYRYVARDSLEGRGSEQRWTHLNDQVEARAAWDAQLAKVPEYNSEKLHLITGAVLPIWDRLPQTAPKVFQLQTTAGERMLGRVIPTADLRNTLKALSAEGAAGKETPAQIVEHIMGGATAHLANGWTLARVTVAGQPRIEIRGPDYNAGRELQSDGAFAEKIGWQTRYFIPSGDEAASVLEKITARRPVTEIYGGAGNEGPALSTQALPPPFYSALERGIEQSKQEKAPATVWKGMIRNMPGVKKDEVDWTGVNEWLDQQKGIVPKADLLQAVRENNVQVEESMHGGSVPMKAIDDIQKWLNANTFDNGALIERYRKWTEDNNLPLESVDKLLAGDRLTPAQRDQANGFMRAFDDASQAENSLGGLAAGDSHAVAMLESLGVPADLMKPVYENINQGAAKFRQYNLPGGENYRELLLTMPERQPGNADRISEIGRRLYAVQTMFDALHRATEPRLVAQRAELAKEEKELRAEQNRLAKADDESIKREFRSPHWNEPNVLAHVRFDDRTGPNGEKVLHVAEIQSDWGQSLRKSRALRDLAKPQSVGEQAENFFGSREVPGIALNEVDGGVLSLVHNNEIARHIVSLLPVDMVDHLGGSERAVQKFASDAPMVLKSFPVDTRAAVAKRILDTARGTFADLRAKLLGRMAGGDGHLLPALRASDLSAREMVSLLAPHTLYHVDLLGKAVGRDIAGARAKIAAALSDRAVGDAKRFPASDTEFLDAPLPTRIGTEAGRGEPPNLSIKGRPARVAEALDWHNSITPPSKRVHYAASNLPEMPLSGNWHELAMKRVLRYAAENGYDRVSWDTGATNADRYDLSKHIEALTYAKKKDGTYFLRAQHKDSPNTSVLGENLKPTELADRVGKEMAEKIVKDEGTPTANGFKEFRGLDLKVGGEGMRGFYDKILPDFVNKYAKKWGAKVEDSTVPTGKEMGGWDVLDRNGNVVRTVSTFGEMRRAQEAGYRIADNATAHNEQPVHSVLITPQMRESVMQGQPMFEHGEAPAGRRAAETSNEEMARLQLAPGAEAEYPRRWAAADGYAKHEDELIDAVQKVIKKIAPDVKVVGATRLHNEGAMAPKGFEVNGMYISDTQVGPLIAWSLEAHDPIGVARHEAIHFLKRTGALTPEEWQTLERGAIDGKWIDKYNVDARYPTLDMGGKLEEAVADHFGSWRRNDGGVLSRLPDWLRPIFQKIDLIRRQIAAAARNIIGVRATASDILTRIESGAVGRRPLAPRDVTPDHGIAQSVGEEEPERPEELRGVPDLPGKRDIQTYIKTKTEPFIATARSLIHDAEMKVAPMARGTDEARASAKDFANFTRLARWRGIKADEAITKNFTPDQQRRMWQAADEQSVAAQKDQNAAGAGLDRLSAAERQMVDWLQYQSRRAFDTAVKLGMVKGEGLPFYVPRMTVMVGSDGVKRVGADAPKITALDAVGRNLKTSTSQLLHRKHLTTEETEEAAKARFGAQAAVAQNIRALPLATARLEEAIAGRTLINQIKELGRQAGVDTVFEGHEGPGNSTFTLDHPAFKTWRPKFETDPATGKNVVSTDRDGQPLFEKVPLFVSRDYEGPLRAVLSRDSGALYKGLMNLKGKTMSVIMYSPLIHNAVEWGRALPAMPGKVGTFRVYFDGNKAKTDDATMTEALTHGLVPIGHRYGMQDITSIMEEPNIVAGRSWTAKVLGAVPGLFDPKAGDSVKRWVDKAGDIWHNTLLWDRVGDLQMGLYVGLRDHMTAKGAAPEAAQYIAAHFANRYAGALPLEAMSSAARKTANLVLFSRSFTLGNLGAMKDIVAGLPRDVQSQIKRDAGVDQFGRLEGLKDAQSIARRKAIATIALDIAFMYAGNSILQSAAAVLSGDDSLGQEALEYVRRLNALLQRAKENPLDVLNPFHDLQSLTPMGENEPGRENRVLVGYAKDGTAIYMRNPTGKIGEEFAGWLTNPLDMVTRKLGTLARPATQILANDKGFGRKVYDPYTTTPAGWITNIGRMVGLVMQDQIPMQSVQAAWDMLHGHGDLATNALQVLGPVAGLTFSKGAPGGPAVGQLYQARAEHDFRVQEALPGIRRKIQGGDVSGAVADMTALGIPKGLQTFYLRTTENPKSRLSPKQLREFRGYATPEQRQNMDRDLGNTP